MKTQNNILAFYWFLGIVISLAFGVPSSGKTVKFSEKDLARESVLPVFDDSTATRKRNILTAKRINLGGYFGMNLNEAFFSQTSYGLSVTYHFNEESGLNLTFHNWLPGLSSYADQLQTSTEFPAVDLYKAPVPKYFLLIDYERTAFYGKLSLSKDLVTNLIIFGTIGGGGITIGNKIYPLFSAGLGQSFFLTRSLSLRADWRFLTYQGPDYLALELRTYSGPVASSAFPDKLNFAMALTFGLYYLFPSF